MTINDLLTRTAHTAIKNGAHIDQQIKKLRRGKKAKKEEYEIATNDIAIKYGCIQLLEQDNQKATLDIIDLCDERLVYCMTTNTPYRSQEFNKAYMILRTQQQTSLHNMVAQQEALIRDIQAYRREGTIR